MSLEISRYSARLIINKLGETGTPPESGVRHFSAGLDTYIDVIKEEYLDNSLKMGLSSFKLLVGDYGAGKTHFLHVLREISWKSNYSVSLVKLSPSSCPFDRLELVYKNISAAIAPPPETDEIISFTETGIEYVLDNWFESVRNDFKIRLGVEDPDDYELKTQLRKYINSFRFSIESNSFKHAVKKYFQFSIDNDETSKSLLVAWLKGEAPTTKLLKEYLIFERLNKSSGFLFIRSLCQFIRDIGYNGLLIFFDEGERMSSISGSKQKKIALDNLRQIVDEAGNSRLPGVLFLYAVTPRVEVVEITEYPALKDRLRASRNLSHINPLSVRIDIEQLDLSTGLLLEEIAVKLVQIYEIAYDHQFQPEIQEIIKDFANYASEKTLTVNIRRLFIKSLISILHYIRSEKRTPSLDELKSIFVDTAAEVT